MSDLNALWDFSNPKLSEQRFIEAIEALGDKGTDEVLILRTQIARTYGLRKEFGRAQEILKEMEPDIQKASAEVRVRHMLEFGRTLASATRKIEAEPEEVQKQARSAYQEAWRLAQAEGLDGLAIDALHMLAFVDTDPADQLAWGLKALAISEASSQPAAKKWEASLRNNVGYAYHQLERYDEALQQFQLALILRVQQGTPQTIRIAHWMIAWTLRGLEKYDEALEIQLRLEQEHEAAGAEDGYVYEELAHLYRAKGNAARAEHYAQKHKAVEAG